MKHHSQVSGNCYFIIQLAAGLYETSLFMIGFFILVICSLYLVRIQKVYKHLHHRYIRFFKAIFSKTFGPQLEIFNYIFILFLEDSRFRIGQTFTVLQNSQQQCTNTFLPCFFSSFFFSLFRSQNTYSLRMAQNEKYNISNAWSFKISHFFYALMATAIDLENTI